MKMRIKPVVLDVIEDDGMWLDKSTMTYYDKNALEPILEPQGLDEAAEASARKKYPYEGGTKGLICEASIPIYKEGFKAGAKWMAEQGETHNGIVYAFNGDSNTRFVSGNFLSQENFNLGDKVIVQIRQA